MEAAMQRMLTASVAAQAMVKRRVSVHGTGGGS
jgi:hypothetical protein